MSSDAPPTDGPPGPPAPPGGGEEAAATSRRLRALLAETLPNGVALAVWGVDTVETELAPEEETAVARAVASRRLEFARGRACARAALGALGAPPVAVPVGSRRQPVWPAGFVGSITHGASVVAAAVAPRSSLSALGIDVEVAGALEEGVREMILAPGEDGGEQPWWPSVVFSAKESLFKALHPGFGRWIPFEAARIVAPPSPGELRAEETGWRPPGGGSLELATLRGGWRVADGRVVTAFWRRAPTEG